MRWRYGLLAVFVLGCAGPQDPPLDRAGVVRKVSLSTGMVRCRATLPADVARRINEGQRELELSTGSGFVIDDTHLVTNAHVVDSEIRLGGRKITCDALKVTFGDGDSEWTIAARVAHPRDGLLDLVLLELEPDPEAERGVPPPLRVAAKAPGPGAEVLVVGYPGVSSLRHEPGDYGPPSAKDGIVSKRDVLNTGVHVIETSASIHQGNSGGPVVDACGAVIGIATFKGVAGAEGESYFAHDVVELWRYLGGAPAAPVATPECVPVLAEAASQTSWGLLVGGTAVVVAMMALVAALARRQVARGLGPGPVTRALERAGLRTWRLVGETPPLAGRTLVLVPQTQVFGSAAHVSDVVVEGVSPRHLEARLGPAGRAQVRDPWSDDGVWINGNRAPAGAWQDLSEHDRVALGREGPRLRTARGRTDTPESREGAAT